ncbi:hypothetical protein AG1IA_01391 [Rhizoctonia solani AG-1 IA]|uniref:Uncharacterized protein n=1 Tax=Thanatephorus cucumeris (strain AG1-IA) TaxID=983506 RepID=L8X7H7_THACA|nr:hypothetical protein AG1IA_01391 [Rhizoctonia solani AG-1 IA]
MECELHRFLSEELFAFCSQEPSHAFFPETQVNRTFIISGPPCLRRSLDPSLYQARRDECIMSVELTPEQTQELITAARDIFLTQQMTVLGFTLMVWDHSKLRSTRDPEWLVYDWHPTFGDDDAHAYPFAQLSWVKVLFLLNRYIPPIFIGVATASMSKDWPDELYAESIVPRLYRIRFMAK